jgi:multicomponent Na+:H+ antiporter subunit F
MEGFLIAVGLFLLGISVVGILRIILGPTVIDRIVGGNFVGTITVVLLIVIGLIYGRLELFIDIALMYSLLSFIGTLIFSKYLSHKGP